MDELEELLSEFIGAKLNNWIKKFNLNFKVEFLNWRISCRRYIFHQIRILDPQTKIPSSLTDIEILIDVDEDKLSPDVTNYEKNTMGLREEMDNYNKGLLRILFYLKATLITIHNFMLDPKKETNSWIDYMDKNETNKDYVLQNIDKKFKLYICESWDRDIFGIIIKVILPDFINKYFYKKF